MTWTLTRPDRNDSTLITDPMTVVSGTEVLNGHRLVGSIVRTTDEDETKPSHYHVEILWSGNDIKYETRYWDLAYAFVRGVEAAFERIKPNG